jgi:hypothetical protein
MADEDRQKNPNINKIIFGILAIGVVIWLMK